MSDLEGPGERSGGGGEESLLQVFMGIAVDSPETLSRVRAQLDALLSAGRLSKQQHDDLIAHFEGQLDAKASPVGSEVAAPVAASPRGEDHRQTAVFPSSPGRSSGDADPATPPDRGEERDRATAVFPQSPRDASSVSASDRRRTRPAGEDKSTVVRPQSPNEVQADAADPEPGGPNAGDEKQTAVFPAVSGEAERDGDAPARADNDDRARRSMTMFSPAPSGTGGSGPEVRQDSQPSASSRSERSSGSRSGSGAWSDLKYQSDREQPGVGAVLKDRFVLQKLVGEGGMGLVFKALDLRKEEAQDRDPHLALKILSEAFKKHPDSLKALQREARKSQLLAHPHIVNVFDFDRDGDTVFMTMEFLEGVPISRVIQRWREDPVSTEDAIDYIRQMAAGLAHAHSKGVVHSDFKPGNAFLTNDGVVKILDFGIAIATASLGAAEGEQTLFDARTLGALTPAYASYEMICGEPPAPSDDIFALGCTAYELLCGRHPYNKTDATRASAQGLKAAPLSVLNGSQRRAIAGAVALRRQDRYESVEEFLRQFDERWQKKWGMPIAAGAAVVAIAAAASLSLPRYFDEREFQSLVGELNALDSSNIDDVLLRVDQLEADERERVLAASSNTVLRFFDEQARSAFAPESARFDFPAAQRALEKAVTMYAFNDAARQVISGSLDGFRVRRNQLLNELDADFNRGLADLESGDYSAAGRLDDVLEIVAQVAPQHPLLQDGRLAPIFTTVAQDAVDAGDYAQARELISSIVNRFPDNAALREVLDRADLEERRVRQAVDVFLIEAEVARLRSELASLDQLPALAETMAQLSEIDPENSELSLSRRAAAATVDEALTPVLVAYRFDDAEQLLGAQEPYLAAADFVALEKQLAVARDARQRQLDGLLQEVRSAASTGNIAADSPALEALKQLQSERADSVIIDQARGMILEAHVAQANRLRADSDWSAALALVDRAEAYASSPADRQLLTALSAQISEASQLRTDALAAAELQRRAAARDAEIADIQAQYEATLSVATLQKAGVEQVLRLIERLSAIDPSNEIVASGRNTIGQRLAQRSSTLRNEGDFAAARQVVVDGLTLLPASAILAEELQVIRSAEQTAEVAATQQRIAALRREIDSSLQRVSASVEWNQQLRRNIESLEAAANLNDQDSRTLRRTAAESFADAAAVAARQMRYTEARTLIQRGRFYAADLPRFDDELEGIARGERELRQRNENEAQLARVEGLKQTMRTQINALDMRGAEQTFASLEALTPQDSFLASEAVQMFTRAYRALAEDALNAGQLERAAAMVRGGLNRAPDDPLLQSFSDRVRIEQLKTLIAEALGGAQPSPDAQIRSAIEELQGLSGQGFASNAEAIADRIAYALRRLDSADPTLAASLRARALEFFPQSKALSTLKLSQ